MEQRTTSGEGTNGAPTEEFVEEWRTAAYNCYSSGHKFCREVCPVMQVTRDEAHTPTAFHANVVAMDEGHLTIEDVARDYVHCTQCGACELRCPNTLFTGDFYRFRTRTVDLVKAARALAVERALDELELERVAPRLGIGQVLARRLPVTARVDVAAAAEEDAVAGVEGIVEILAVQLRQHERDATCKRDRALVAHAGVVPEVL
jgi:Fe-S oxidoreductase